MLDILSLFRRKRRVPPRRRKSSSGNWRQELEKIGGLVGNAKAPAKVTEVIPRFEPLPRHDPQPYELPAPRFDSPPLDGHAPYEPSYPAAEPQYNPAPRYEPPAQYDQPPQYDPRVAETRTIAEAPKRFEPPRPASESPRRATVARAPAKQGYLAAHSIEKTFGTRKVVKGASLYVRRGEAVGLLGPNGAGKTSLLNCITGAYRASEGRIVFEEADITREPAHNAAKRGIARTFQHNELFPQLTVLENLLLGRHAMLNYGLLSAGMFFGRSRSWELAQREKVEAVVEFFDLEPYRKQVVGDLPYGIQKLIGLARAFAAEPRLVLLDEPSAGLNRQEKEDLARYLLRVRHEFSPTMIWIEHDMQLVRDLADKVLVLHYGRELAYGLPDKVLSDPQVIEAYIGKR